MKLKEFIEEMNRICPESYQESFDNTGLQVGDKDKIIKKIYLALDLNESSILNAIRLNADLILTHHPLLFRPIKKISKDDFIGKRVYHLIQNDIAHYAMHTNFDAVFMRDMIDKRLGLKKRTPIIKVNETCEDKSTSLEIGSLGIGSVGELDTEKSVKEIADLIMNEFNISSVRIFGDPNQKVKKIGVLAGSGKSEIDQALSMGVSLYITGDVDHHTGLDAVEKGISVIDATHYGLEKVFTTCMKEKLNNMKKTIKTFKDIEIIEEGMKEVILTVSRNKK